MCTPRLAPPAGTPAAREREFFIDNLLVRIHFIIVMIRWTGLAEARTTRRRSCHRHHRHCHPLSLSPSSTTICREVVRLLLLEKGPATPPAVRVVRVGGDDGELRWLMLLEKDPGPGFQVQVLKTFKAVPSSLGSGCDSTSRLPPCPEHRAFQNEVARSTPFLTDRTL